MFYFSFIFLWSLGVRCGACGTRQTRAAAAAPAAAAFPPCVRWLMWCSRDHVGCLVCTALFAVLCVVFSRRAGSEPGQREREGGLALVGVLSHIFLGDVVRGGGGGGGGTDA